mmetsp:Transcript_64757/g.204469  ORF Transcript_64757/g.204469 Transcript_64757/m.204469 type:complete len:155 (+) Transcript_64757:636-1100(+)
MAVAEFDAVGHLKPPLPLRPQADACTVACQFYRAELTPPGWGEGGFFGPPYALLQGGIRPLPGSVPVNTVTEGHPPVRRGSVAWAGGAAGPDFFIATADHPEWGTGHTVWGEVADEESMALVEAVTAQPTREVKGEVITTPLLRPVRFSLELEP